MKTLDRILSVLFSISLCAALVSCAARTNDLPQPVSETTETVAETQSTTALPATAKPTTAKPTTTKAPTTAKPTTTKLKTTEPTTAKLTATKPWTTVKPTTTKAPTTAKPTERTTASTADYEAEVFRLMNQERKEAGLAPLDTSDELQRCAEIRAKEIKQKFSHTRPNGKDCFSLNPDLIMGENIAYGQTTPQQVMDSWMNSKGHRENILRERFTLGAVACYYDKPTNTYYWVQLFA